jgi:two-component system, NtrC family, nitrogen regulation sensor histidine kinase NtrY
MKVKSNHYSLIIISRTILITLNSFILAWIYLNLNRPATLTFFFISLIYQTYSLIYYLNRINRDLSNFLIFLQENDTTLEFTKGTVNKNFSDFTINLSLINKKLQEARIGREQQHFYLRAVVEHIGVGLIVYNDRGNVEIINSSAKDIFGIQSLKEINKLTKLYPELMPVFAAKRKNTTTLIKLKKTKKDLQLTVKSSNFKLDDATITLVSFQNIKNELDIQEIESWRKLIKVQRHEIMNSITPITTLTTAIKRAFRNGEEQKKVNEIVTENIDDALNSVEVIEERSKGLINFIERFRSLTELPCPQLATFNVKKMAGHIGLLFSEELKTRNIIFLTQVQNEELSLFADEKLIEQVFINLVKNSMEAIHSGNGKIQISAFSQVGNVCIQVKDNGEGIKEEALDSIFIPAYSTKETGMGIGLSISKQIVQLHSGMIEVRSIPNEETIVEITFPEHSDHL